MDAKGFLYKCRKRRRLSSKPAIKVVDHHSSSLKLKKINVVDEESIPFHSEYQDGHHHDELDDDNGALEDVGNFSRDEDRPDEGDKLLSENDEYRLRLKKAAVSWSLIKSQIVQKVIEMEALPVSRHKCTHCNEEEAVACCHACGSLVLYCAECIKMLHNNVNITHSLLVWKEEELRFVPLPHTPLIRPPHNCCVVDTYYKEVTCADVAGIKKVKLELCKCFDEVEALTLLRWFPATPKHPQLVFTYNLLNLLECLFLECQVSVRDFVTALQLNYQNSKIENDALLYPAIIDCFEQYRHIKHDLRTLKPIIPLRENNGTKCPACFLAKTPTIAIDANFGLCRKMSAGSSVANSLHIDTDVFCNQSLVDDFVSKYGSSAGQDTSDNECHKFLATDALRSKSRYRALDETGIVGAVCKHEIPCVFFSLRHGERFSYIVYAMEEIKRKLGTKNVNLLYDVACTLERHLKKEKRDDLLSFFKLAIPVFHSYGHKVDCQLHYSPRNISGYGMADGECCERLWSYLRRFARITKESRPSRRIDILTDALLYYGRISSDRLETLLPQRYHRFHKLSQTYKNELQILMKNSPVPFTYEDIMKWYKSQCKAEKESSKSNISWEDNYFKLLQAYHSLSSQLTTCSSTQTVRTLINHIVRIDKELQEIEKKHGIKERVEPDSSLYKELNYNAVLKQLENLKKKIGVLARERWFLLILKAKFADGQYLSSRLSASISKATTKLKSLLREFNSFNVESMSWKDVSDLSSHVWYEGVLQSENIEVPLAVKLKAIENYHVILRCEEELQMLSEDMRNVVEFYILDHVTLNEEIVKRAESHNLYDRGCVALLLQVSYETERKLLGMEKSFSTLAPITLPTSLFTHMLSSNDMSQRDFSFLQSSNDVSHDVTSDVHVEQTPQDQSQRFEVQACLNANSNLSSTASAMPSFQGLSVDEHQNVSLEPLQTTRDDILHNMRHDLESDDESSDEFEQQFNWRRKRFEREEYLQELQAITGNNPISELLEEHKDLLTHMKSAPSVVEDISSFTQGSFLNINAKILRQAVASASRDLALTGPHFVYKK